MISRLVQSLSVAGLALVSVGPGAAVDSFEEVPHIRRVQNGPQTAGFSATLLEAREEIAVVEVTGDYGITDDTLRFAAMHEYYTAFPDEIDIVVAFTTFDFDSGGALALATLVRNEIQGIGLPQFDESAVFGSSGRLESFVDMKNIAGWETDPRDPGFDRTLSVLLHEIQHRWGSYIDFEDSDGTVSSALLGRDASHWSYLLDSQASVLYGSDWENNGDGTFTATSTLERLSPLDLYLGGLLAPDEVPPIGLIENPAIDATDLPQLGAVVDGAMRWIEIEDVIAAEGPRVPSSQEAPRSLRVGFMLLTRPGQVLPESTIADIRRIRSQVATRFAVLTGGRGILRVEPSVPPDLEPGLPGGVTGTGNQPTANFESGLEWLALQRSSFGYFEDAGGTRERDTVEAVATLLEFDESFDETPSLDWLSAHETQSVDALARREHLLHEVLPTQSTELIGYQDDSGGFGISNQFDPDPLDSALALEVLSKKGLDGLEEVQDLLLQLRNPDGGWSPVPGGPSRTSATAHVLRALGASGAALPEGSVAFLLGRQNPDGGFGDSPSTSHDTAMVLLVLADHQALPAEVSSSGLAFLLSRQSLDFSWDGSVYATSLALRAWNRLENPTDPDVDLAVVDSDLTIEGDPLLGQDVVLGATLRNLGAEPADAFDIRFLVDDGQDVIEIHYERVQLGGGETLHREIPWRVDRIGSLTFEVEADVLDEVIELDEDNNQAQLAFETGSADQVNWSVEPEALSLVPSPGLEGRPLLASLEVTNWGGVPSPAIDVALYDGDPAMGGVEVARGLLPPLAPAEPGLVSLEWPSPSPTGNHILVAVVDPDFVVDEIDETDNSTFAHLEVVSLPDAAVSDPSLSLSPTRVDAGQLVRLTALVSNLGAQNTGPLIVRGLVGPAVGEGAPVGADQVVEIAPGATQTVIFEWIYDGGTSVVSVLLDPSDGIREGDESNNIASIGIAEPSSDFFVSERYFSPNGDGIRDVTRFYFAVTSPQDLTVEILSNRGDRRVLAYQGPELMDTTAGSYAWDGRDAAGRSVADGEYRFVVSSADGIPLGIATTTLDTDRRPLLEAAGTAYERTRNLTCAQPTVQRWLAGSEAIAMTKDEQWLYLTLEGSPSYPAGLYRMRPDGRSLMQVVSNQELGSPIRDLTLSPDGQWLAYSDPRWVAGSLANFLMVGRPDGSELRARLDLGADWLGRIVGFDSQSRIILSDETSILAVGAEGAQPPETVFSTVLDQLDIVAPEAGDAPFSRDRALIQEFGPASSLVGNLSILDLDSGEVVGLDTPEFSRLNGYSWSPDGHRLALSLDDWPAIVIFEDDGNFIAQFGEAGIGGGHLTGTAVAPAVSALEAQPQPPRWSRDGESVAWVGNAEHESCSEAEAVLVAPIDSEVTPVVWVGALDSCIAQLEFVLPGGGWLEWDVGVLSLLYANAGAGNGSDDQRLWTIHLDRDEVLPMASEATGYRPRFSPSGRDLSWLTESEALDPESVCFEQGSRDLVSYISLMNLTADLRPRAVGGGGAFRLEGTASDLNLQRWWIEYEDAGTPGIWNAAGTPSAFSVIDGLLTSWIPPHPGTFTIRLTVEDRAGNRRRSFATLSLTRPPSIADLALSHQYFSPNGDGLRDHVDLEYEALLPVQVVLRVLNEAGQSVRTLTEGHIQPGPGLLRWDGRNESGQFAPDGRYTLVVEGAEFEVVLDTVAPSVGPSRIDVERRCEGEVRRLAELTSLVEDDSPLGDSPVEILVARAPWEAPQDFQAYASGGLTPPPFFPLPLGWSSVPGARFRILATDRAGNRGAETVGPAEESLTIVAVFAVDEQTGEPQDPAGAWSECSSNPVPLSPRLGIRIEESVARAVHEVYVQYQELPLTPDGWQETLVAEVPSEGLFEITWTPPDPEGDYHLRVRTRDAGGGNAWSDVVRASSQGPTNPVGIEVIIVGGAEWEALDLGVREDFEDLLRDHGLTRWDDGLVVGRVTGLTTEGLSVVGESQDDARYEPPQILPLVYDDGQRFLAQLAEPLPCARYGISARVPVGDGTVLSDTSTYDYTCLGLSLTEGDAPVGECEEGPLDSQRSLTIELDGAGIPLALLTLTGPNAQGLPETLFSLNGPADPLEVEVPVDLSVPPEGTFSYEVRLVDTHGESITRGVEWTIDHTPPVRFDVDAPPSGRLCPAQLEFPGSVEDNFGVEWTWTASERNGDLTIFSSGSCEETCEDIEIVDATDDSSAYNFTTERLSGVVDLAIEAIDPGGFKVCHELQFTVDRQIEAALSTVDFDLISPNLDGTADSVAVTTVALEPLRLNSWVDSDSTTVRTLVSEFPFEDEARVVWDGADENGVVVADGEYWLVTELSDGCANLGQFSNRVEVDNTPPELALVYPGSGDPVATIIDVVGSISDLHLEGWWLEYGIGGQPNTWAGIASSTENQSGPLASWNTFGLEGLVTLRLRAVDGAGNAAETAVQLDLAPLDLVSSFGVSPHLFSPNGDGELDQASFTLGVTAESIVDLTIFDAAGDLVVQLLDAETVPPGPHSVLWDGLRFDGVVSADGPLDARLEVHLLANPQVSQTEEIQVVVDGTAPAISLASPSGPFEAGEIEIVGSVADPHLSLVAVAVNHGAEPPVWEEVFVGTEAVSDFAFATLTDLEDSVHSVRLVARDAAGNRAEEIVAFQVDSVAPVVEWISPEDGGVFGAVSGPLSVLGSVQEEHLAEYRLEITESVPPLDWQVLVAGTELPLPAPVADLDLLPLPDGPRTLRLIAEDLAGNATSQQSNLTIDNTDPTASILAPGIEDWVLGPTTIEGSAFDANLESYSLALAPGLPGESDLFSPIGTRNVAVVDGSLLEWVALPVDGIYTLRLRVDDRATHRVEILHPVRVDQTAPEPPQGLNASLSEESDALVEWSPSSSDDVQGYRVRRDGEFLFDEPIVDTSWIDPGLEDGAYVYTVVAVDAAGWESEPSAPAYLLVDTRGGIASIQHPVDGARVGGVVEILGTAASDDLASHRLTATPTSTGVSAQLAESTVSVYGDLLADWTTTGLGEEETVQLRLEVENLAGYITSDEVVVTIDNLPPAAPTGLEATPAGEGVAVVWDENLEPDLAGYLLYRNDQLANAAGPVLGDLEEYILDLATYDDATAPDGLLVYQVYAVDQAGNQSPPSDPVELVLDRRAPTARIVEPYDGADFDGVLSVVATTNDLDILQVAFERKTLTDDPWILVEADESAPWSVLIDPVAIGLTHGDDLFLRAVGTDIHGSEDPDPASVRVRYMDLTPPPVVTDLVIAVDGGAVTLTWLPVDAPDLAGYHVDRTTEDGVVERLTTTPWPDTTLLDLVPADGTYLYEVIAVDGQGNESAAVESEARIYTPTLTQPFTPVAEASVDIDGSGVADASVETVVVNDLGTSAVAPVASDFQGRFHVPMVPLEPGRNTIRVSLVDGLGNRSRRAEVVVARGMQPAAPAGLQASVDGTDVTLGWDPNLEDDLLGYRILREGDPVPSEAAAAAIGASASSTEPWGYSALHIVDGLAESYWLPEFPAWNEEWVEVELDDLYPVHRVEVLWGSGAHPGDYDIEAWTGDAWVPLVRVRSGVESEEQHEVAPPYRSDRFRLVMRSDSWGLLDEVRFFYHPMTSETSSVDSVSDGAWVYSVIAASEFGFESPPSAPLEVLVGDTEAPPPVVASASAIDADVTVSWTDSAAPDLDHYVVRRDGLDLATVPGSQPNLYLDLSLPNGTYGYEVLAVDLVGNESPPSNQASATVAVATLGPPRALTATADLSGDVVGLAWLPPIGVQPEGYRVARSDSSGGPYGSIGETIDLLMDDLSVETGGHYFYVVYALDAQGNAGEASNEAEIAVLDLEPPARPQLYWPTLPDTPIQSESVRSTVRGLAEPGTLVTLFQNGFEVDSVATLETASERSIIFWPGVYPASPDGRFVPNGYEVLDLDSGSIFDLVFDGPAHWFPDATRMAIATDNGIEIRHRDGNLLSTLPTDLVRVAVPSPLGDQIAVVGVADGRDGLLLLDLEDESWSEVVGTGSWSFEPDTLGWSPDGSHLSYLDWGGSLRVLEVATGQMTYSAESTGGAEPRWAPNGRSIVYTALGPMGGQQIRIYNLDTYEITDLPQLTENWALMPLFSPDGRWVASWVESDGSFRLERTEITTGRVEVLTSAVDMLSPRIDWTSPRGLIVRLEEKLLVIEVAGTATFADVLLELGDNHFTAIATDASDNASAPSDAIEVERLLPDRADLAIEEGGVTVLPAVSVVGEETSVTIRVDNLGLVEANAVASLGLRSADGSYRTLVDRSELGVVGGGSSISGNWVVSFGSIPGPFDLVVVVDPLNQVPESNETNNRVEPRVFVTDGSQAVQVMVTTDRAEYAASGVIALQASVVNTADPVSGVAEVWIADAQGAEVARIGDRPIHLEFGEVWTEGWDWSAEGTLAGQYAVHVDFLAAGGDTTSAEAAFTILPTWTVNLDLSEVALPSPIGTPVDLQATFSYEDGNALLEEVAAEWNLSSEDGTILGFESVDLGTLVPGAAGTLQRPWNPGLAGTFLAEVRLRSGPTELATDSVMFQVLDTQDLLQGALSIEDDVVAVGFDAIVDVEVLNLGTVSLEDLPIRLTRIEVGTDPEVIASFEATLPPELPDLRTFEIATEGWSPGSRLLSLEAWFDDGSGAEWHVLDSAGLATFDGLPPQVAIEVPEPEQVIGDMRQVRIVATDDLSPIGIVEVRFDGGEWERLTPSSESGLFTYPVDQLPEGPLEVEARAEDEVGNTASAGPVDFVVDRTPPRIDIQGAEDDASYPGPVTLLIGATDLHLDETLILLNGELFESGQTLVEPGRYHLVVSASDLAGNTSSSNLTFWIGPPAPAPNGRKTWTLEEDVDQSGGPSPADIIRFSITVGNGGATATRLGISDPLSEHFQYIADSLSGGVLLDEEPLIIGLEPLDGGEQTTAEFLVRIDPALPDGIEEIANQAEILWSDGSVLTDDPTTPEPLDPTVVVLGTSVPNLTVIGGTTTEGSGGVAFHLQLDRVALGAIEVSYETLEGSATEGIDYQATAGRAVVPPGSQDVQIVVPVVDDAIDEPTEDFWLVISDASGATITLDRALGAIEDNDGIPLLQASATEGPEGDVGQATLQVQVSMSHPTAQPVYVSYSTSEADATAGIDFVSVAGVVELAPGETTGRIEVEILGDRLDENDEVFFLDLSDPVGCVLAAGQTAITILDDDEVPQLLLGAADVLEGDDGISELVARAELSAPSGRRIEVSFQTLDGSAEAGSDYVEITGRLTLSPGSVEAPVTIEVLGDQRVEGDEWFMVNLFDPESVEITVDEVEMTILDDDPRAAVIEIPVLDGLGRMALLLLLAMAGIGLLRTRRGAS